MAKGCWSSIGDGRRASETEKAFLACVAKGTPLVLASLKQAIYDLLKSSFYLNLRAYKTCDGFWGTSKNKKCLAILQRLLDDRIEELRRNGYTVNPDGSYSDPAAVHIKSPSTSPFQPVNQSSVYLWFGLAAAFVIGLVLYLKFRK